MWYVYILKSSKTLNWTYVGMTDDIDQRMKNHNMGLAKATKPHIPVNLVAYVAVETKSHAAALEQYFKTGSGKAVLNKRILQNPSANEAFA